ncbi:MAG: ornithine carbamoyltransferase [Piscirickettsiaceae bacterium CG_4_9_14_3_um_filter_43_564]|nr:ornithine carbamoyltransferase [Thiomicrospira sp.]PIQ04103.1 MAG: ornithine carbamoyltransferase [Piscirickettsiaceae bacterium CG18_big_fil_WC_8_21_14_2_50_44_103]PIU38762.1 MAG: ornithine carbamoyltransferase [Piscirickettsiaceae bacterium CG07_land_8_20_14_0_80_44_28]PIW58676.1 MAG: ornithine carbamoyltransferase [Piscirickettsiaceae bacterium CG12_big_fil_rev_8_21_14_0_65_44_934]PIW76951.1 MAG: ornithine carbamoyltransferase [Piscirickettsiaceae bacterium CG_4_8_14_3_um_filter_44_38]PI
MKQLKHFLTLQDFTPAQLHQLLIRGIELKAMQHAGEVYQPLKNKTLAMIFEKSSTRTRISFEIGMTQLGGHAVFLSPNGTQIGRGEPIEDTAKVISSMADGIMIRTFAHQTVETLATHSRVPVINALTDDFHPCQLLADMQTYYEQRGSIEGKTVLWVGDGNNMCHSYINAALQYGFKLRISTPEGYEPNRRFVEGNEAHITEIRDPMEAAEGVDLVVTDVWASMGQEEEQKKREKAFKDYQVTRALMAQADKDALFMHCLPAHRGEEVSAEIMDDPKSVVWDEAENRLHAQKALLEYLLAP